MGEIEVFSVSTKKQLPEGFNQTVHLVDSNGQSVLKLEQTSKSWQEDLKQALSHLKDNGWRIISVFPASLEKDCPMATFIRINTVTIIAEK